MKGSKLFQLTIGLFAALVISACGGGGSGSNNDNGNDGVNCPQGIFGCITLSGSDTAQTGTSFSPTRLITANPIATNWDILSGSNKALEALNPTDITKIEVNYFGSVQPIGGFENITFEWQVGTDRKVFFCDSRSDQGVPQCGGTLTRDDNAKTVTLTDLKLSVASFGTPNSATGTVTLNGTLSIDTSK